MAQLKDVIKYEYAKCLADPNYFIKRYCYIQHPERGKIKFDLYPFQERLLGELQKHNKTVILKSRQLGISTVSAAYALWMATFHSDKFVLVLATKQSVAKNIITKVQEMYEKLPAWLKKDTQEYNKMSIRFTNGSQIKAESTTKDSGRSLAVSLLIVDEAAFIEHIEEIWASAQQTLATGGQAIVLSTPYGVSNFFHKLWVKAEEGKNGFYPIRLHWTVHPERDQAWRDRQDRELGKKLASQECDCLWGQSTVTIRDKDTGEIENITLEKLYERLYHSEYTKNGWDKTKTKLDEIVNLYSKEETRKILLENDYYLSLFGRAKNRTLQNENPRLYKSIMEHTKILQEKMDEQGSYFGNYNFTNRILFIVEHNYEIESLRCECGKKLTFTKYCRECPEPKRTWVGKKHTEETKTKMRISAVNYISSAKGQCTPRYNVNSIPILEAKAKELGITDLQHAENGGEFYVEELGYWLDGYSPEKNIAFEYDESHHFDESGVLRESDVIRQQQIENLLGCQFIRIKGENEKK